MKTRTAIISLTMAFLAATFVPDGVASNPQTFTGVLTDNGYVAVTSNGDVRYNLSNDGGGYYGYCGHHHRKHRCRHVRPPRHHHKKFKKKHHHPKKHKKHNKHDRHHRRHR